ncbi:isoquinoline 1-oxidoreductase, beta subunit [Loktanella fryxellensis]|uniref:Isoquinoline 1-oxidoreductase, beta subunit n=1 Tax=Loktanella fryxellensis TaxID=245187 RepID=A0A1H8IMI8_9RHOB|nr:hypothetical protein [Loktanella fryxellensis]SEN70150.1 isoquinoline 1-oxidoreductase, beta subunit [Loktanella fryxellensis]
MFASFTPIGWSAATLPVDAESTSTLSDRLHATQSTDAPRDHIDDGVFAAPDANVVAAGYSVSFVAHACMEPMNATAILRDDGTAEV